MNLPNKLTIARIILIPLCLLLLYFRLDIFAGIVFIIACLTDFIDGYIARKRNMVTNFGKFADPVADKILVVSVMVLLLHQGRFPWWALLVIVVRELAVDGIRLVAIEQGVVIAAGNLGKIKTTLQMLGVIAIMFNLDSAITMTLNVLMTFFTIVSGLQYIYEGRHLLLEKSGK
ncbi:MAG: CDP-diacylglycerol--glycerol-3-phosphate 3-phosphatidyltransferase [Christensenellales bacterium]|nr:CDP-diacylglycerol--glycerol-3-phosphate 3-phosphatidyltransferase [Christensenellaceae bacterium]